MTASPISIRLTPEEREHLNALAASLGGSLSDAARYALETVAIVGAWSPADYAAIERALKDADLDLVRTERLIALFSALVGRGKQP